MKKCPRCGEVKLLDDFYRTSTTGKYHSYCKPCHKIYRDAEYEKNKDARLARQRARRAASPEAHRARNAERRARSQQIVWRYLLDHSCVDCGESDPVVLEFDHIADNKTASVSALIAGASVARLEAEMVKCEVVCANCHRRRTYTRAGSWRVS